MEIRKYAMEDREGCLGIFDSCFPTETRAAFIAIIDGSAESFCVAEHDGEIVGCGGYSIHGEAARLHWGMVGRKWQRQGVGRFLLFYRMREITKNASVQVVGLRAPLEAVPFFLKQGFREAGPEGEMIKRLVVCT